MSLILALEPGKPIQGTGHDVRSLGQLLIPGLAGRANFIDPGVITGQAVQGLAGQGDSLLIKIPPESDGGVGPKGEAAGPIKEGPGLLDGKIPVVRQIAELGQHLSYGFAERFIIQVGGVGQGDRSKVGQPLILAAGLSCQTVRRFLVSSGPRLSKSAVIVFIKPGQDLFDGFIQQVPFGQAVQDPVAGLQQGLPLLIRKLRQIGGQNLIAEGVNGGNLSQIQPVQELLTAVGPGFI